MSKREPDEVTGVETTGHEWDGIRELDNPLPRWWLYMFWAGVVVAAVYWVLMPAWPGVRSYTQGVLGQSDRADVVVALNDLKTVRGAQAARLKTASLEEIERDPELQAYAQAVGQSVFGDNCATCHGVGGVGAKGYANLRDDVWLWGGSLEQIHHTIQVGIRSDNPQSRMSQMPAFGRDGMLPREAVQTIADYVLALRGGTADPHGAGAQVFAENCVACHGEGGRGGVGIGAPSLTGGHWIYGGDRGTVLATIHGGRQGVMPSWAGRLTTAQINLLAVFVSRLAAHDQEAAAP